VCARGADQAAVPGRSSSSLDGTVNAAKHLALRRESGAGQLRSRITYIGLEVMYEALSTRSDGCCHLAAT